MPVTRIISAEDHNLAKKLKDLEYKLGEDHR